MGGILGGPQTVNTGQTQNTLQNVNQASQQQQTMNATEATAANPLAQTAGGALGNMINRLTANFSGMENGYGTTGLWWDPSMPERGIAPLTQLQLDAMNQASGAAAGTGVPMIAQGGNYFNQAGDLTNQGAGYFPQAQNYIGQGANYFGQGADWMNQSGQAARAPITGQDVAGFYNPFAENVTANLQDIFGQQNLANRIGSTAQMGGVGGSRAAVGQALLAQKQGLTAGGVYADLYQRALQAAQQQKAQQVSGMLGAGQGMLGAGQGMIGAGQTQGGLGAALAGMGQGLGGLGLQGVQAGSGLIGQNYALGKEYQNYLQNIQDARYQKALMSYQEPFQVMASLSGALPPMIGLGQTGAQTRDLSGTNTLAGTQSGIGVGTGQTTYPAPSTFSQLAGLGTLGAGLFGMFSDRRAKTDIQKVGKDPSSGLPMFAFRYKGDPKTYPKVVGPMAQDVEKKYPDAVKQLDKRQGGGPVVDLSTSDYTDVTDAGGGDSDSYSDNDYSEPDRDQDDSGGLDKAASQAQQRLAQTQLAQQKKRQQIARQLQQLAKNTQQFQKAFPQPGAQYQRSGPQPITWPKTPWGLGQMPAMQGGGAVAPAFGGRLPNMAGMNWARSMGPAASSPSMFGGYSQPMNYGNLFANARSVFPPSIGRQEGGRAEPETAELPPPDAPPPIAPPATVTDPSTGEVAGFSFNADTPPGWITSSPANPRPGATSLAGFGQTQGFPTGATTAPTGPTYGPNLGGFFAPRSAGPGPFPIVDPLTGAFVGYRSDRGVPTGWGLGQLGQRKGGRVLRRDLGGPTGEDPVDEIESLATQLAGDDEDEHEPAGMPTQESIPLPTPRPSGDIPDEETGEPAAFAPRGLVPPRTRGSTATGLPRFSGAGSANPYMALMQAGLGMLAASGQRDARGLPMSPLGAIGTGGMMGLQSYQTGLAQQQKDALAQQNMSLKERALRDLMQHRRALETVPRVTGTDKWGNPIRERYNPASGKYEPMKAEETPPAQPVEGTPPPMEGGTASAFTPLKTGVAATADDANKLTEQEGAMPANARLVQHGLFDYATGSPGQIQKGFEVPNPSPIEGPLGVQSSRQQMQDAANYLETGKLPSVSRGNSPVARQQQTYQNAVKNYAGALAESLGMTPQEVAHQWRMNPAAVRWMLGLQGRSATGMGTAMRHLDSLEEAYKALDNGNIQLFNEIKARLGIAIGAPAPVALNAMRQIVGTEIIKGLGVAQGGTYEERKQAADAYAVKLSPEQFRATKGEVQGLLAGQLVGRLGESQNVGVTEKEFKRQVGTEQYDQLQEIAKRQTGGKPFTPLSAPEGKTPGGFTGRTATGPGGKKLRETTDGNWVP